MRIRIGIGLGPLVFGMCKEEVIQHLGKPDKSVTEDFYHSFYYNSQHIRLDFSAMEEFKLNAIEVYNPRAVLFGQTLIGKGKSEILDLLSMYGYRDSEQEDYETFETVYCQDIESEFSFEFNKLISISFHTLFDQYDQAVWPDKESEADANDGCLNVIAVGDKPSAKCYGRPVEIKIGIGLYNLYFGMLQQDVMNDFGVPDKISETEKENGIVWYYNEQMIKAKFDLLDGGKLYSVEVYHPNAVMFNHRIISMEKQKIIDMLIGNGQQEFEAEDFFSFDTIFCRGICTTFSFVFDRLTSIEFSPLAVNGLYFCEYTKSE